MFLHQTNCIDRYRGFSLIELMVAMTLGLLLSLGIITLLSSTSDTNRLQDALARLQENSRYAMSRLVQDVHNAGGQYCTNFWGEAQPGVHKVLSRPLAPTVYIDNLTLPDLGAVDAVPGQDEAAAPYALTPRYFIQGYRCVDTNCAPTEPAAISAIVPGTNVGQRVVGADILTVRYVRNRGTNLRQADMTCDASNNLTTITATPAPFQDSGGRYFGLVASCAGSAVVEVDAPSGTFNLLPAGVGVPCPSTQGDTTDVRLFDFNNDFVTVTYYLGITDADADGKVTPSLMRRENGGAGQALVDGVERLNFLYGVEDIDGNTRYLTADQVQTFGDDAGGSGAIPCPPNPLESSIQTDQEPGCLWRAIKNIEVFMLINTVNDVKAQAEDQKYVYSFDESGSYDQGVEYEVTDPILPSGLAARTMLRREFRTQISVMNYNP